MDGRGLDLLKEENQKLLVVFPTEYQGIAWIQEYKKLAREKCGGGAAAQAKPSPA